MSRFYPPEAMARARANAERSEWAAQTRRAIVAAAEPWMGFSDEELWKMMFGPTISRSWMVWSNGYCPACKRSVPMYNWKMDPFRHPWKTQCPHCDALFPKNDFAAFYESGLDIHGIFQPSLADRSLLFNTEHPDPDDPLHDFGVDDGEGYVAEGHRWRFIGAYLIYGQWKRLIVDGVRRLADAYTVTGDPRYAHKAGVLLDRIADLYPSFDFSTQGYVYETAGHRGYVTVWHDACEETRELALAFDQVKDAVAEDGSLALFLANQAGAHELDVAKYTPADVVRNIENGLLQHPLDHRDRIRTNYPRDDIAVLVFLTILDKPGMKEQATAVLDALLDKSTAVDGLTGERGLAGYSVGAPQSLAHLLGQFARTHPDFLRETFERHPRLHEMYRFHLDTLCLGRFYPEVGDTGSYGRRLHGYIGVGFTKSPGLRPSMFTFMWQLYELTNDPAFVQLLYHANGDRVDGLPYDLFAEDPEAFQASVRAVIEEVGPEPTLGSVLKREWRIGILRSGDEEDARAAWLYYDSGGAHGHRDGMNLGLFAKGLDLMPDFGYPPVQFGGWGSPRARWYTMTAAHNTIVVDGKDQQAVGGDATLWADGDAFRAIRAACPEQIGGERYERTVALIDLDDRDGYLFDLFRVVGGTEHAKFQHSFFGALETQGLDLSPTEDFGHGTQMRHFRIDETPEPGWEAMWHIEDRYGYRTNDEPVGLRYVDLTSGAEVAVAEAWIAPSGFVESAEEWIPRLMVRRRSASAPLESVFVAVIEPFEGSSQLAQVRRLTLPAPNGEAPPNMAVAVEVTLRDGRRDLLLAADGNRPLVQPEWEALWEGDLAWVRRRTDGVIERIGLCGGRRLRLGGFDLQLTEAVAYLELAFVDGGARIVAGSADRIAALTLEGRSVPLRSD